MTRLHMVLLILICIGADVLQSGAETLPATEEDDVTLPCSLSGTFTYPEWRGPPSLLKYTNQGSPAINTAANASARLSYAANNRDLLLKDAVVADSGEYKCTFPLLGEYAFSLTVSEKTTTSSTSTPTTSAANTTGSTTSPPNVTDSDDKKIIIGVSVGVVIAVVLAILIGVCCYFKYKNKERKQEHSENKVSYSNNQGQDVQHGRFSNKSYETENKL